MDCPGFGNIKSNSEKYLVLFRMADAFSVSHPGKTLISRDAYLAESLIQYTLV